MKPACLSSFLNAARLQKQQGEDPPRPRCSTTRSTSGKTQSGDLCSVRLKGLSGALCQAEPRELARLALRSCAPLLPPAALRTRSALPERAGSVTVASFTAAPGRAI